MTDFAVPNATPGAQPSNERLCNCGSGRPSYELFDARGIGCGRVCDSCVDKRKATYRPEIFTNPNYWADEPI